MNSRVYILLDVLEGRPGEIVENLRCQAGVVVADVLEGSPNIALMIEATNRRKLARPAIQAIASIENVIASIRLLPTRTEYDAITPAHRRTDIEHRDGVI